MLYSYTLQMKINLSSTRRVDGLEREYFHVLLTRDQQVLADEFPDTRDILKSIVHQIIFRILALRIGESEFSHKKISEKVFVGCFLVYFEYPKEYPEKYTPNTF